jgi:hypothetical protein
MPGLDKIWVRKLKQEDPEYIYDTEEAAIAKIEELQSLDSTGRLYKVEEI